MEGKKETKAPFRAEARYSSISSSDRGPYSCSSSIVPSSDVGVFGGVASGCGGTSRCLCGGEGDLYPLAARRASRFLEQALACTEWGPRQFPRLVVALSRYAPSTGHLWLTVLRFFPHRAYLGVVEHLASMWP